MSEEQKPADAEALADKQDEVKEPASTDVESGGEVSTKETPAEEAPASEPVKEEAKEEKPVEKPKEDKKPEPSGKPASTEPSGRFKDLIKEIEGLSALELAELVKELEERFGVSAAAPVAVAGAPAAGGAAPEAEEKSAYTVVLASSGDKKIEVIKAIREINPELGLKEAKDLADNAPKEVKKDAPKEEAEEAKKKLEAAGGTVELK